MNEEQQSGHHSKLASPVRRRRWKRWLAGLLIFGCGMVVGAGGMLGMIHGKIAEHHRKPPGHVAEHVMRRLDRKLKLTEEQSARVGKIVQGHMVALREIRDEAFPRVRAELEAAREEISAELTPEQEAKWRKHYAHLERMLPPVPPPIR